MHRNHLAPGFRWAATAFYLVAVAHGLVLHRRNGTDDRQAWAPVYGTVMSAAFVAGTRRGSEGDAHDDRRLTVLLVAFYALIRLLVSLCGPFEGDDRHLRGAVAEASLLLLAYALVYGSETAREGNKTQ